VEKKVVLDLMSHEIIMDDSGDNPGGGALGK